MQKLVCTDIDALVRLDWILLVYARCRITPKKIPNGETFSEVHASLVSPEPRERFAQLLTRLTDMILD